MMVNVIDWQALREELATTYPREFLAHGSRLDECIAIIRRHLPPEPVKEPHAHGFDNQCDMLCVEESLAATPDLTIEQQAASAIGFDPAMAADRKRRAVVAEVESLIDLCAGNMAPESKWSATPNHQELRNIGAMISNAARAQYEARQSAAKGSR